MSQEALVAADLEGPQAGLLLGPLEPLLHAPAGKRRPHHLFPVGPTGSVADEILVLAGGGPSSPEPACGHAGPAFGGSRVEA